MATNKEFSSAQNTTYLSALIAAEMNTPEEAIKIILSTLRAGMEAEQANEVEKAMEKLRKELKTKKP